MSLCSLFEKLDPLDLDFLICDIRHYLFYLLCKSWSVLMVRELESILHNEIPVLVHNKVVQTITLDQFLKDLAQVLWLGLLNRSIDYIRRALLHAKLINLAKKLGNDFLAYFFIPKLKCLLNSVIAVRILRQLNCMGYELLHEADSVLLESGLCYYKLHHAQSMIVH